MFELGPEKLLMLLLICLVIFGGKRIPEIGGAIGKGIREFKRSLSDVDRSIKEPDQANMDRLNTGEAQRRDEDKTSEPKRLMN